MHKKYANPMLIFTPLKALLGSLLSMQIWLETERESNFWWLDIFLFLYKLIFPSKDLEFFTNARVHIAKHLYFWSGLLFPIFGPRILFRPASKSGAARQFLQGPSGWRATQRWKITGDCTKSLEVLKPTPPSFPNHSQHHAFQMQIPPHSLRITAHLTPKPFHN